MSNYSEKTDEWLVQAWGLAYDAHNELHELLEYGQVAPSSREEYEGSYHDIEDRIEAMEAEMTRRGMFLDDELGTLKPEFSKFLSE